MRKIITMVAAIGLIGNAQAGLKGDSVMSPGGEPGAAPMTSQSFSGPAGPALSSSSANEIQYGTCPSGFTYQGSSTYPLQIRSVTTYYMNGTATGSSASGWTDLDSSCTKTETQSIGCPSDYTGNQLQQRTVATKDGGGYDYSTWNTYQNNCVYNPPRKSGVMSGNIATVRGVTFGGWGSPQVGVTLDYGNAALRCTSRYPYETGGDAGSAGYGDWVVYGLGQNTQYGDSVVGMPSSCTMSNSNKTATIYGNCNSTSGGDGDYCQGATFVVNITSVNGCTVSTETRIYGQVIDNNNYNICN